MTDGICAMCSEICALSRLRSGKWLVLTNMDGGQDEFEVTNKQDLFPGRSLNWVGKE